MFENTRNRYKALFRWIQTCLLAHLRVMANF